MRGYKDKERFDYPEGIYRVTAAVGGEVLFINGAEKTAIYDCGMAFAGPELVQNIKDTLKKVGKEKLDYIFASHSHYDHVGAMPYVRRAWPEVKVIGSQKCKDVFERPGALQFIRRMNDVAQDTYSKWEKRELLQGDYVVDIVVKEGDRISLGGKDEMVVLEAKGHTDCSLAFVLEPLGAMFMNESTGVYMGGYEVDTSILKSYRDAMATFEKCKAYPARYHINPHFGLLEEEWMPEYWAAFLKNAEEEKDLALSCLRAGKTDEEVVAAFKEKYYTPLRAIDQPIEAFTVNAIALANVIKKEFIDAES